MVVLHAKFGQILRSFCIFEILKFTTHKICPEAGASIGENVDIFEFRMMRTCTLEIFRSFGANLGHQKVQKLPKNDLSASFWTHRRSLGSFKF